MRKNWKIVVSFNQSSRVSKFSLGFKRKLVWAFGRFGVLHGNISLNLWLLNFVEGDRNTTQKLYPLPRHGWPVILWRKSSIVGCHANFAKKKWSNKKSPKYKFESTLETILIQVETSNPSSKLNFLIKKTDISDSKIEIYDAQIAIYSSKIEISDSKLGGKTSAHWSLHWSFRLKLQCKLQFTEVCTEVLVALKFALKFYVETSVQTSVHWSFVLKF